MIGYGILIVSKLLQINRVRVAVNIAQPDNVGLFGHGILIGQ